MCGCQAQNGEKAVIGERLLLSCEREPRLCQYKVDYFLRTRQARMPPEPSVINKSSPRPYRVPFNCFADGLTTRSSTGCRPGHSKARKRSSSSPSARAKKVWPT